MIKRRLSKQLKEALNENASVALLGPRQVGKTTLAMQLLSKGKSVYIDLENDLDKRKVEDTNLENVLAQALQEYDQGTVVLRSDKSVPVQYVVTVIDAVNQINQGRLTKHKVILATKPK